jgi:hypothetical protein
MKIKLLNLLLALLAVPVFADEAKREIKLGNWYPKYCAYELIFPGAEENVGPWFISPEELISIGPKLETKDGSHGISGPRMKKNPYEWVGAKFMSPADLVVKYHLHADDWADLRKAALDSKKLKCIVQPGLRTFFKRLIHGAPDEGEDDTGEAPPPNSNEKSSGAH